MEDMNARAKPKTMAQFRLLQSTATSLDSYMTINFNDISLAPGDNLVLDSCIYYDNWPRFSEQQNVLVVHSGNTLLWGTPPNGITMATIQSQETETVGQTITGWG